MYVLLPVFLSTCWFSTVEASIRMSVFDKYWTVLNKIWRNGSLGLAGRVNFIPKFLARLLVPLIRSSAHECGPCLHLSINFVYQVLFCGIVQKNSWCTQSPDAHRYLFIYFFGEWNLMRPPRSKTYVYRLLSDSFRKRKLKCFGWVKSSFDVKLPLLTKKSNFSSLF